MTDAKYRIKEYDFNLNTQEGLFVSAAGFEDRSIAFISRLRKSVFKFEQTVLLRYISQQQDNDPNYQYSKQRLSNQLGKKPRIIPVHSDHPIRSFEDIKNHIGVLANKLENKSVLIDISGMTHLWAIATIHSCLTSGLRASVVFTEARWYYPLKGDYKLLVKAWKDQDFKTSSQYLQSKALKSIHITPEFGGNFRPGFKTCLIIFVGYEPNRIQGLVDSYAPGRLIVLYGKSPHKEFHWRTELSRQLHEDLFSNWYVRETGVSTLRVDKTIQKLEEEFQIIKEYYDVAIAPQCSKMQALASYLFWRRHPEVQLVFTSPVSFNPKRYSRGSRRTFVCEIV